ncbi:MAG TPA: hypothetical protein VGG48_05580 [Rhizomicrobium sp.]|jgi:uncharacterized membrane protein
MSDASQPTVSSESSLKLTALLSYGLMLLACTNGFTALIGVVIAYVKREDARGTLYESHFRNIIAVFWTSLALFVLFLAVVGAGIVHFFGIPPQPPEHFARTHLPEMIGGGVLVWGTMICFAVWYLYRVIKGFVRALDGRAY